MNRAGTNIISSLAVMFSLLFSWVHPASLNRNPEWWIWANTFFAEQWYVKKTTFIAVVTCLQGIQNKQRIIGKRPPVGLLPFSGIATSSNNRFTPACKLFIFLALNLRVMGYLGPPELVQHFRLLGEFTSAQERCMS